MSTYYVTRNERSSLVELRQTRYEGIGGKGHPRDVCALNQHPEGLRDMLLSVNWPMEEVDWRGLEPED